MFLSVFDLFKIGIGPSSSHTMGPMIAAGLFLDEVASGSWPRPSGKSVSRLRAHLYGSLALTGVGHATDRAIALGLDGAHPSHIEPGEMAYRLDQIRKTGRVKPVGNVDNVFDLQADVFFH